MFGTSPARFVPDPEFGRHGQIVFSNGMCVMIWSKEHGLSLVLGFKDEEELSEEAIYWLREEIKSSALFNTTREYMHWLIHANSILIDPAGEGLKMSDIEKVRSALLARPSSAIVDYELN